MDSTNHTNTVHKWELAQDQSDTGTHGVRVICKVKHYSQPRHVLTVHRDLLEGYI